MSGLPLALRSVLPFFCAVAVSAAQGPAAVFNDCRFGPPATLDPHVVFDLSAGHVQLQVYETLYEMERGSDPLRRVPCLAAAEIRLSPDRLTVEIPLREGVFFHDDPCFPDGRGREFDAEDVVFLFKRHADPRTASPFYEPFLAGFFEGLDTFREKAVSDGVTDMSVPVPGVTAVDRKTVRLRLTRRYPQLPALLAHPFSAIVPREAVQHYGSGLSERAVGTGPFCLEGAADPAHLVLRRNPRYHGGKDPKTGRPLPLLDEIRMDASDRPEMLVDRLRRGELDILHVDPRVRGELLDDRGRLLPAWRSAGFRLETCNDLTVTYICFNMTDRLLGAHRPLRQALALAMDRRAYLDRVFGGGGLLADHMIPPGLPEHAHLGSKPWAFGKRDVKRAKDLLGAAGFPGGAGLPEIVLDVPGPESDPTARVLADILVTSFREIGVRVQPRFPTFPDFMKRVEEGSVQMAAISWFADYPDAENFLQLFLSEAGPATNFARYGNADYDALYAKASLLNPGAERMALIERMVGIVQEDCPWIFGVFRTSLTVVAPSVRDWSWNLFTFSLKKVWKASGKPGR